MAIRAPDGANKEEKIFLRTDGRADGPIKGSTGGPRGPKNYTDEQWVESLVGDEGATTNAAGTPTLYSDNPGKKYVIAEKDVSYELWQM